jgi:hypothetical protein
MATQLYRLAKRRDEDFTVGTGAQMTTEFGANIRGKLVVDVRG